ncbi:hypothetical protein J6590_100017 [Homalodisca vitripennis]|nr:hypothetical protein J6590_014234 [Homalodisca vitripennis]KAG8333946.1 hypothetical protein J6590_100017 [Homalodisca vitripennis]
MKNLNLDEVVWIDETWVNTNHSQTNTWTDDSVQGTMSVPLGKGGRMILLHAEDAWENEGVLETAIEELIITLNSDDDSSDDSSAFSDDQNLGEDRFDHLLSDESQHDSEDESDSDLSGVQQLCPEGRVLQFDEF